MKIESRSFKHNQPIPEKFAFCKIDPDAHAALADNHSPHLAWSDLPPGTQSLVLICVDTDAPSVGDNVNQEGKSVAADLPRADFHHWLLANIPPDVTHLEEAACSNKVTPGGKSSPAGPPGSKQGRNDYTGWFAGDENMKGTYLGYDGPAPPWNDERIHHYHFNLYAISKPALNLPDAFTADQLKQAIKDCTLEKATITGTYTLNPKLRK